MSNAAKTEAIANANAHLSNAGLPTYTQLMELVKALSTKESVAALRTNRMTDGSHVYDACVAGMEEQAAVECYSHAEALALVQALESVGIRRGHDFTENHAVGY